MAQIELRNPLDNFSSYSVHYVMLACRTTTEARDFIEEGQNDATLAAINNTKLLGDTISYKGKKDISYLVMDTRRFSQFSVEKMKYETLINGIEAGGSHANLVTTMEMTILDSVGISFINFLQWLMDTKMQCNFDGMIFMLRVIFVGHHHEGKTETVQTITIPMHLLKLEVNLDYGRGTYTAEFMPNINFDANKNKRWLNISQASSFFTGTGSNKLGAIIDSFERALNKRSQEFYDEASSKLRAARGQTKFGRLVKYMITLPEQWNEFIVQGWGTSNSTETIFKKFDAADKKAAPAKPGTPIDTTVAVQPGTQITQVLDTLFRQVPQIAALGAGTEGLKSFNYFVGITSSDEFMVVHVDVAEFLVPNIFTDVSTKQVKPGERDAYRTVGKDGKRIPNNYFEYDYIFTGKNKDILNFDMKIQDLQWMLVTNREMGAGVMNELGESGQGDKKIKVNPQAELVNARAFDPLLLPRNTEDELNNFSAYSSLLLQTDQGDTARKNQQDFRKNLTAFYAASPITTHITIKGNPLIMQKFCQNDFMPHVAADSAGSEGQSNTNMNVKADYRKALSERILKDNVNASGLPEIREENGVFVVQRLPDSSYGKEPVFVKLNVKGPNVDFLSNDMIRGEDFATEILTDMFFVVFKVTNTIEGAMFTQELELYSHNIFGNTKTKGPPDSNVKKV